MKKYFVITFVFILVPVLFFSYSFYTKYEVKKNLVQLGYSELEFSGFGKDKFEYQFYGTFLFSDSLFYDINENESINYNGNTLSYYKTHCTYSINEDDVVVLDEDTPVACMQRSIDQNLFKNLVTEYENIHDF